MWTRFAKSSATVAILGEADFCWEAPRDSAVSLLDFVEQLQDLGDVSRHSSGCLEPNIEYRFEVGADRVVIVPASGVFGPDELSKIVQKRPKDKTRSVFLEGSS